MTVLALGGNTVHSNVLVDFKPVFRFRLKSFLLIVLALNITIAYWSMKRQQRLRQLDFIYSLNGTAVTQRNCDSRGIPPPPTWRSGWVANAQDAVLEPLSDVVYVDLSDSQVDDGKMAKLVQEFDHLVHLDLSNTQVTDQAILGLLKFKNLRFADLSETRVTPRGLKRLTQGNANISVKYSREYSELIDYLNEFEKGWDDAEISVFDAIESKNNGCEAEQGGD